MSLDAALLEVRDLTVSYERGRAASHKRALCGVSLRVRAGEIVGVIGETGSGKSTLARAVLGLVKPERGSVQIAGAEVSRFSAQQWRQFRRSGAAQYVFQDPLQSLNPDLPVAESIAEPLSVRTGHIAAQHIDAAVRRVAAQLTLDPALLQRYPSQLSGGQRQRVVLARALITDPQLLVLDEPVSALDAATRVQVLSLLTRLRAAGTGLLFISHDLGSIAGMTDRVCVLYRGEIVEDDLTQRVINRPRHPYTRLLLESAPTLTSASSRSRRALLRADLQRISDK
jgi:ABC-type glutathione transport system ATPase component